MVPLQRRIVELTEKSQEQSAKMPTQSAVPDSLEGVDLNEPELAPTMHPALQKLREGLDLIQEELAHQVTEYTDSANFHLNRIGAGNLIAIDELTVRSQTQEFQEKLQELQQQAFLLADHLAPVFLTYAQESDPEGKAIVASSEALHLVNSLGNSSIFGPTAKEAFSAVSEALTEISSPLEETHALYPDAQSLLLDLRKAIENFSSQAHLTAWATRTATEKLNILEANQNGAPIAKSDRGSTHLETQVTHELLDRLEEITLPMQREPGSKEMSEQGGTIAKYDRETFEKLFASGAKCITYRVNGEIEGYALYSEPHSIPEFARDLTDSIKQGPTAFGLMIARTDALREEPFFESMLDSIEAHLQRTGARSFAVRVESKNSASHSKLYSAGFVRVHGDHAEIKSRSGKRALMLGFVKTIDPNIAQKLARYKPPVSYRRSSQASAMQNGNLVSFSQEDTLGLEPKAHIPGVLSQQKAVEYLLSAEIPFAIRLTGGMKEMKPEHWTKLHGYFERELRGFKGAWIVGDSKMWSKTDEKFNGKALPGVCDVPTNGEKAWPRAIVLGALINGDYGRMVQDINLITHRDKAWDFESTFETGPNLDIPYRINVDVEDYIGSIESEWDAEFAACNKLLELTKQEDLRRRATDQDGDSQSFSDDNRFKHILISYNGGGTTRREIETAAMNGDQVVLIKGSGRDTHELATDESFKAQYPNVHVVDMQEEGALTLKMIELGGLPPLRLAATDFDS